MFICNEQTNRDIHTHTHTHTLTSLWVCEVDIERLSQFCHAIVKKTNFKRLHSHIVREIQPPSGGGEVRIHSLATGRAIRRKVFHARRANGTLGSGHIHGDCAIRLTYGHHWHDRCRGDWHVRGRWRGDKLE